MHELQQLLFTASELGHAPQLLEGLGASTAIGKILGRSARRALVVASDRTVREVPAVASLIHHGARHYGRTRPNPSVDDALDLSAAIEELHPDIVLAVGGGSAIDQAKAGRLLRPERRHVDFGLQGRDSSLRADLPLLIAIPTTAGTGAELTPFATLYRGSAKVSLDLTQCRPNLAVLDGQLTLTCPDGSSLAAALDAMCHAIESAWSLAATPQSRRYADAARNHLLACVCSRSRLPAAGKTPDDAAERHLLLLAAAVAGVAISQTRTTGAHAFAYHLTTRHGVPHGFACAASLSWVAAQIAARQPDTLDASTRDAVASVRSQLDHAQATGLLVLPLLEGTALEAYVDAGLSVHSRLLNHPVPLSRAEALHHVSRDGRLVSRPSTPLAASAATPLTTD